MESLCSKTDHVRSMLSVGPSQFPPLFIVREKKTSGYSGTIIGKLYLVCYIEMTLSEATL